MRVTFISPYYHNIWESLGIGYIASYCKENYEGNLDLRFFHGNFDSRENIIQQSAKSDIVCFSCTSPTFNNGIVLTERIKNVNNKVHIVFGGWHVSAIKKIENNVIDQIIVGEGEKAFLSILEGNRNPVVEGARLNFDNLPWPDRELIRNDRTLDLCEEMCGERIASFQSRRGCPMSCVFCAESCMTGESSVRVRDAKDLLDEMEVVANKYKITMFKFLDPTWCYPKSAANSFCEEKIRRGFNLKWEAMAHAAFLDKKILKLMKKANCDQINVGCESGDQKILNDMKKGVTTSKIRKVFKWGKELGINMRAFFILGMPNESESSLKKTEELIKDINPDVFGITLLAPYPGSNFYSTDRHKLVNWAEVDEYSNNIWYTKNFSNQDLRNIQKNIALRFRDKLNYHQKQIMDLL